jgi:hypothetical protein
MESSWEEVRCRTGATLVLVQCLIDRQTGQTITPLIDVLGAALTTCLLQASSRSQRWPFCLLATGIVHFFLLMRFVVMA